MFHITQVLSGLGLCFVSINSDLTWIDYSTLNLMNQFLLALPSRQKQQQLPMETHENLIDAICLWTWLAPKLQSLISPEYMEKLTDMFRNGKLGLNWFLGVTFRNPPKTRHTPEPHLGSPIVMGFLKNPSGFHGLRSF